MRFSRNAPGAKSRGFGGLFNMTMRGGARPLAVLGVAALSLALAGIGAATSAAAKPEFGSVAGSPGLPGGFDKTFKSRYVEANGVRQHVVIGGDGPPLLLIHGWPENWYAWRHVMPKLAEDYTVIVPDQRGIGLTEKPATGYDSATLAEDMAALMTKLGHDKFAVAGHDTGYIIGYALAADHRDRVERIALAEIPGPPGVGHTPSLWPEEPINDKVWHIPFNRVNDELIVDLVHSNAQAFYDYEFRIQAGGAELPEAVTDYYTQLYTRDKDVLRTTFGLYRAWEDTVNQNVERAKTPLTIPVLAIGGETSWGPYPGENLKPAASDVHTVVIPGNGHWLAETAPRQILDEIGLFLEPYRNAS